jgi:hypothetical protein
LKSSTMKSFARVSRVLPALLALSAASWGMSAYAQATPAEKPAATESVGTAAKKAAKATAEAGSKVGAAVTRTGEKIGDKLPQTEAYKKKNKGKKAKAKPIPEAG